MLDEVIIMQELYEDQLEKINLILYEKLDQNYLFLILLEE